MSRGPNREKLVNQFPQAMRVGVGTPTQRNCISVSTSNASWGGDPNKEKLGLQFPQAMRVGGAPTQRN
ncbi:hypothetical protein [Staphylococcus marylandisciuri]|uniref:hypothetical protein n=1 Tax=Staphylococcus marylandisciuri TaxID=2981529 RepID=UPI0021D0FC4A|nr:hypothetical protein [Staphylococcus marylandisciuri]